MKLYSHVLSGHSHKVRLFLGLIGKSFENEEVDIPGGGGQAADHLARNPLGSVPVLVDGDLVLRDSQAILVYLAARYGGRSWWPADAAEIAKLQQWLSFAANELHNGVHLLRLNSLLGVPIPIDSARSIADRSMAVLDRRLDGRSWLEDDKVTLADVACFPSSALAGDGGIDLASYPNLYAWTKRIKSLPGYVGMSGL